MTALRCTTKLLRAMKAAPEANPASAQNRLGEWTANLIRMGRIQLVLAVNERTRLEKAFCLQPVDRRAARTTVLMH